MKKVFIYYSFTSNGDKVANYLKRKGFDIYKIETVEKMPDNQILRILKGGFLAGIKAKVKIKKVNLDLSKYNEVYIGSPIWNGNLTPAINTVLEYIDKKDKITFILYSGSGKINKITKYIEKKYINSTIISLRSPVNNKSELELGFELELLSLSDLLSFKLC